MSPRSFLTVLLALAAVLATAAPAAAGGTLGFETPPAPESPPARDGLEPRAVPPRDERVAPVAKTLTYAGDDIEPSNVTVALDGDTLVIAEDGSRIALGAGAEGCRLSADRYRAECPARDVERISVRTGNSGSDVRILAPLPAQITGGAGDDLLIGGPAADVIDGGSGQDVIGGGGGADELHGGPDNDLVTYVDRIGRDGALLARREAVAIRFGERGASGARDGGEGDTIHRDFEQVEGGAGADRIELRDGVAQSVACNGGRDTLLLDPLDDASIDCESSEVASANGGRIGSPTLIFPFPAREDRARSVVRVKPVVGLVGNAIVVRIRCQNAIGLLAADGPGCRGTVRMTRGSYVMGTRRVELARGRVTSWRIPLTTSLSLARRGSGLPVTVTAIPTRGAGVRKELRFTAKG